MRVLLVVFLLVTVVVAQDGGVRDANVPVLPFADNPDPLLCGIPESWRDERPGVLTGVYKGELIEPVVRLYDSHLRRRVVGEAPAGTRVTIKLFQVNPDLNYYFVRTIGLTTEQSGWVPAPFLHLPE